ncbi:MAG: cohesin domain-containing protein [bacterium]|nr:cohesin domain-containing protein [bacterium]
MPYLLTIVAFAMPALTSAATLTLVPLPTHIGSGDSVQVTALIESQESVNAFSGSFEYPPSMEPLSISDGSSIVSIWIERPTAPAAGNMSGTIRFAGVTPGGFSGTGGKLFSVVFRATTPGIATFSISDVKVLRDDGAGSSEPTSASSLTLRVATVAMGGFVAPVDTEAPEPFTPQLGEGPAPVAGQAYLAFTAADKGSGTDHYEAAETRWPTWLAMLAWTRVDSPYTLRDQYLTSDMYIKAVDRAGNERIAVFHRSHLLRPYEWVILCAIIVVLVAVRYRPKKRPNGLTA